MTFNREPNAEPIPGYRLIEPLGSGGFGEVWKCEAPGGLYKAIKFVYGNLKSLDVDGARAEQEYKALGCVKEVRHPFVLSLERIEEVDGELLIVMELADKSLYDVFVECQAAGLVGIPRDDLLRYMRDAAEALDHMIQKHNLLHLDIKPRNLFLISDRVKVADFGLVKHLEAQSGVLNSVTPLYAPPETFTGKISEHSDQYSLAIVYQEMLTGKRPFNGKNARQLLIQHTQEEPELRNLPEAERPIIARALAKDPTKRFPNCLSFVRALFNARPARKAEDLIPAEKGKQKGPRPRNMSETLEDLVLDQLSSDEDVDLGAAPVVQGDEISQVSQHGLTTHQPQTGALRPTVIIGLGGFGRRAILELRCRFLDRFGDLSKIPMLRFLYLDPDGEAVKSALRGTPELACTAEELYHLALQPISNYRRRNLESLYEWLPQEKLFSLPRSLQTAGGRALGRLAFVDHQMRLFGKVKQAVQKVMHPDALYRSVSQTGLALRDNRPRIYVIGSAGGGGSGLLTDIGFGLRRLLQQMKQPNADVTGLIFCGAPDDPATPKQEQANVYATLTELNHFNDPNIPFTAQYGVDAPRLVEQGKPYNQVYLLRLLHRSPEALRDSVAHLGSYLFHELTTPLGIRLENLRKKKHEGPSFRSFGTYAVWFPRGLLLRLAARRACVRLLKEWQQPGEPTAHAEVEAACAKAVADPELRFDALCARIEAQASTAFEGNLGAALTGVLSSLEEQSQQSVAQDDMANWVRQALGRMQDWVGTHAGGSHHDSDLQKSRLSRALIQATQKVGEYWDQRLSEVAFGLMEHPGKRTSSAEAALNRFVQFCGDSAATNHARLEQQMQKTRQASLQLDKALESCLSGGGGFSLFGGRNKRLLRVFMDHLAAYSRQCVGESLVASGLQFYSSLRGRLDERLRELTFCRQRLRNMQENLELTGVADDPSNARYDAEVTPTHSPMPSTEAYWDAIRESETARLVLPDGEDDLERAADRFLKTVKQEQWTQLDQSVQDLVLAPLGGLHKVCVTNSDLARSLANPVLAQLSSTLGNLLPVTDVADVEFSAATARRTDISASIRSYYGHAAPLIGPKATEDQASFLLIPASDKGKAFGEAAKKVVPDLDLVLVPGQADLMFCREQGYMTAEDFRTYFRYCRTAYDELSVVPNTSPHARFDITDWVPLDP